MNSDDVRRAAAAAGLDRLSESDLGLLAQSLAANRLLAKRLPSDLHWSDEIAPALRLADRGPRGESGRHGDGHGSSA